MAILASLQTFLKYSEQAGNHRKASTHYQALFNEIDQRHVIPPKDEAALREWCNKLRERRGVVFGDNPALMQLILISDQ